ncbi:hypothetical protein BJV40_003586 [Clostridium beijerinckii]|nr:hypothetical protein [Clostridium beijerinckii]
MPKRILVELIQLRRIKSWRLPVLYPTQIRGR